MFLRKFTSLKNVGRFKNAFIRRTEFKHYTLIYGGNGKGKTTLCAALRSLSDNDPSHVVRRRTFNGEGEQQVQVLLDSGTVTFNGSSWSEQHTNMHIFDQHFIARNVHVGEQVGVDQRRGFYQVIVGATGVELAAHVDRLDAEIAAKQAEISAEQKVLAQHLPRGIGLEAFVQLPKREDALQQLTTAQGELSAAQASNEIFTRAELMRFQIPELPHGREAQLAVTLPEVEADAASRVQRHLSEHHTHRPTEAWLFEGTSYTDSEACPFCGATMRDNELIKAYTHYFSGAYTRHLKTLRYIRQEVDEYLGKAGALRLTQNLAELAENIAWWSKFSRLRIEPYTRLDSALTALQAYSDAYAAFVDSKIENPFEPIDQPPELEIALREWQTELDALMRYWNECAEANLVIEKIRSSVRDSNPIKIKEHIDHLRSVHARSDAKFIALEDAYNNLLKQKTDLMRQKQGYKRDLDRYDESTFREFEDKVNAILKMFGVKFSLARCGKNYVGGTPQSAYCIAVDGFHLDVTSKPDGKSPTFQTTLSAGDKNTFAIAFFIAQLQVDQSIGEKIIVFDDPFTSLDEFRRETTAKAIVREGAKASQTIVFSHDKHFLEAVRSKIHNAEHVALQISKLPDTAGIESWDIEREVKDGYLQEHMALQEFVAGTTGDAASIRTRIAPVVEQWIRYRFPNQIPAHTWLGGMVEVIRDTPDHPLKPIYDELDDINEFTRIYRHDPNADYDVDAVQTHASRALELIGGW